MTQNFNSSKIYKITNDYNDEVYVGSTCDTLIKRYSTHKSKGKNEKYMNIPLYKTMNEIGIERFRIDLVEDYPCNDKMALRQREGFWIREIGTLNKLIAGRTDKECKKIYRDNNKDVIKEKSKIYYEENKNEIMEKNKSYYEANRDEIKKMEKERNKTPERIAYKKEWKKKKLEKQQLNI